MLSLLDLCAQKVVSDHASFLQSLPSVPHQLYPPLFTAAFAGRKTLVLQDLVQRWPFPVLSLQDVVKEWRHASQDLMYTVIQGVVTYLGHALTPQDGARPERAHHLRLLDMTGPRNAIFDRGPSVMNLWSRTVALAEGCISLSKKRREEAAQAAKRRRGLRASTPAPPLHYVEVRVDLFVNRTSYSVLREALRESGRGGPLRLRCRVLRAEELSLRSMLGLLELLEPTGVRQIDLRFNNLGLPDLNTILTSVRKFSALRSLKLPYSNVDVRRVTPDMEDAIRTFATLIGQLTSLRGLNLGSSRLTGRVRELLGSMQAGLESVELAFCFLVPADLYYLAQSLHVSSLKKLDLSGNNLSELLLPPFLQLLAAASSSLIHLDIMECKLGNSALPTLVPALCRCSRLRYLGLFYNPLSSQGLKTLLHHFMGLGELRLVVYPYPTDCYGHAPDWAGSYDSPPDYSVGQEKLTRFTAELEEMLARAGRMDLVWTTDMCLHRDLDYLDF